MASHEMPYWMLWERYVIFNSYGFVAIFDSNRPPWFRLGTWCFLPLSSVKIESYRNHTPGALISSLTEFSCCILCKPFSFMVIVTTSISLETQWLALIVRIDTVMVFSLSHVLLLRTHPDYFTVLMCSLDDFPSPSHHKSGGSGAGKCELTR